MQPLPNNAEEMQVNQTRGRNAPNILFSGLSCHPSLTQAILGHTCAHWRSQK